MYMYSLRFIFNESPWIYEYIHIHQHAAVRGHAKRKFLLIPPSFISNCGWWIAFMWFPIIFFLLFNTNISLLGRIPGTSCGQKANSAWALLGIPASLQASQWGLVQHRARKAQLPAEEILGCPHIPTPWLSPCRLCCGAACEWGTRRGSQNWHEKSLFSCWTEDRS